MLLRVGPVDDCAGNLEVKATLTFAPGLTIVGVLAKTSNLDESDATWGVAAIEYSAQSRGLEGSDVLDLGSATVELTARIGCTNLTDEIRILVDHGSAFQADAWFSPGGQRRLREAHGVHGHRGRGERRGAPRAAGRAGQVLMTGATVERLEDEFDVESLGPKKLTGRDEPVEVFCLLD